MLSILDRLIVIDGGRIIADGPRDEVLKMLSGAAAGGKATKQ
jgi:ATP-binding cassette subfamily C protein LapB